MQLISFAFFLLFSIVYILLYVLNKYIKSEEKVVKVTNWILLVSSFAFVLYADYRFAVILAALCLSTWLFGRKKDIAIIGILISLAVLAIFKYFNFFADSFAKILGKEYTLLKIILPLGISFYTFSAISYLMDIKRGKTEPKDLVSVALYLSYFPKITSGPIQKSRDFFGQISRRRKIGWSTFSSGIQIFVFGLFKKLVLADRLSVFVDQVYGTPLAFNSLTVFLATIAYSLQIYLDFSGYSDMAIGISKMLDIELPKNFNIPYLAHNVTELWKRWHITLSSWLQEYLYIPLGGNRKGKARNYLNLILTMTIGGLWHGANWTYIIWGLMHGIALVIHKVWMKTTNSAGKHHSSVSNLFSILITFLFTNFCWVFFRTESVEQAFTIIKRIFLFDTGISHPYIWFFISLVIVVAAGIIAYYHFSKDKDIGSPNVCHVNGFYPHVRLESFWGLVLFFVIVGLIVCLAYTGGSPFIYGSY